MHAGFRLYYLDDIPTPYRLDVHRRIAELWPGQYKLAFCAASEPGRNWSFDFGGLDVEILPGAQHRPRRQVNPISVKLNPRVWHSLDSFRPHVVAISGYMQPTAYIAAAWCRRHRVPYGVSCETSLRSTSTERLRGVAKRLIAGWIVRNMSFGLPVGREAADYLIFLGAREAPMFFFPNTPDVSRIAAKAERIRNSRNAAALRAQLGIENEADIILFVGRMINAKCPLDALFAFREMTAHQPNSVLVFVGDGPLMSVLKTEAAGDKRIIFTGWISDPEKLAGVMAIASILILPSQHETWGAVVNEAMAASTVVIASDRVGAAIELIDRGRNGFIYSVNDIRALAKILSSCLADRAALHSIGRAARQTALANGSDYAAVNFIAGAMSCIADQ